MIGMIGVIGVICLGVIGWMVLIGLTAVTPWEVVVADMKELPIESLVPPAVDLPPMIEWVGMVCTEGMEGMARVVV